MSSFGVSVFFVCTWGRVRRCPFLSANFNYGPASGTACSPGFGATDLVAAFNAGKIVHPSKAECAANPNGRCRAHGPTGCPTATTAYANPTFLRGAGRFLRATRRCGPIRSRSARRSARRSSRSGNRATRRSRTYCARHDSGTTRVVRKK